MFRLMPLFLEFPLLQLQLYILNFSSSSSSAIHLRSIRPHLSKERATSLFEPIYSLSFKRENSTKTESIALNNSHPSVFSFSPPGATLNTRSCCNISPNPRVAAVNNFLGIFPLPPTAILLLKNKTDTRN